MVLCFFTALFTASGVVLGWLLLPFFWVIVVASLVTGGALSLYPANFNLAVTGGEPHRVDAEVRRIVVGLFLCQEAAGTAANVLKFILNFFFIYQLNYRRMVETDGE